MGATRLDRPLGIRDVLALDPEKHPWVTRRWVLRGDPGAGKTTLLRHLASTLAREEDSPWVPVFTSLQQLMREREPLLERLDRQMARAGSRGLAPVLEREAEQGRLLLLLDGLDEVPRDARAEAEALLRDLSTRWPKTVLVVTTRPIGYHRPDRAFLELDLLPLGPDRRREFLGRWFGRRAGASDDERAGVALAVLEGDGTLRELAGNPLYLTLMALLLEKGSSPERNRTRLYDQVFDLLMQGGHREPPTPMDLQDASRRMLRYLGYGMTVDNRDAEAPAVLEARLYQREADDLREPLERLPRWRRSLRPFLDDLAECTGILGPHAGPGTDWRFWHRTFREALAAEGLEERLEAAGPEAVLECARAIAGEESRWAEPYALLVGRVKEPDELVRTLVKENRDLGLRAVATAQGLADETLYEVLDLSKDDWKKRALVYRRIPELVKDDSARALALLEKLRRRTRSGNDLYFLDQAMGDVGQVHQKARQRAEQLRSRLYDHIPPPPDELFQWAQTQLDGRVPLWCQIPGGSFRMGSPHSQGNSGEHPRHEVQVPYPIAVSCVPVTNALYVAFDPSFEPYPWPGVTKQLADHPAVQMTWYAAVSFCRWLSASASWARGARLPSESEWEYVCRAGTDTKYWSGNKEKDLQRVGWYSSNSRSRTHRVGGKPANKPGLYDVHGNVREWTSSPWIDYSGRKDGITLDPSSGEPAGSPAPSASGRVIRGGGCWGGAWNARSAFRGLVDPRIGTADQGFRVLLPRPPEL